MADEHITTHTAPDGSSHSTVVDRGGGSGSGGWIIGLLALVLVAVGVYFFSGMSTSEANKDNAVAEAARDVGNAAQNVGNAAEDAASSVSKN
jgi:uncharacterized protein HemX